MNPIVFFAVDGFLAISFFSFIFVVIFCFYAFLMKANTAKHLDRAERRAISNEDDAKDLVTLVILE